MRAPSGVVDRRCEHVAGRTRTAERQQAARTAERQHSAGWGAACSKDSDVETNRRQRRPRAHVVLEVQVQQVVALAEGPRAHVVVEVQVQQVVASAEGLQ